MQNKFFFNLLAIVLSAVFPISALAQSAQPAAPATPQPLFADKFEVANANWKFTNHQNRLAVDWKTVGGKTCVVFTCPGAEEVDTAFDFSTKQLPLSGQQTYQLSFEAAANFPPDNYGSPHRVWRNRIEFYDEAGKMIERQHFGYWVPKSGFRKKVATGKIPANAKSLVLTFGGDAPNIAPGQFLAITNVVLEAK